MVLPVELTQPAFIGLQAFEPLLHVGQLLLYALALVIGLAGQNSPALTGLHRASPILSC